MTSGYSVCINFHHSETKAQQLLESIQSAGHKAIAVKADISGEAARVNPLKTGVPMQRGGTRSSTRGIESAGRSIILERLVRDELGEIVSPAHRYRLE